jgi:carotenoid cleavage dioxygenase-like enzyme
MNYALGVGIIKNFVASPYLKHVQKKICSRFSNNRIQCLFDDKKIKRILFDTIMKMFNRIFLILILGGFSTCSSIIPLFRPIRKHFTITSPSSSVLHNLDGFFGFIGPNVSVFESVKENRVKTLYELFTGDGLIQGIFFDGEGELQPYSDLINTEKRVFEKKHGKIPTHFVFSVLSFILYKMKLTPNLLGYANTALGWFQQKLYVFFERDMPYLLDLDFDKKCIRTVGRVEMKGIDMCSGHTKYDSVENNVHTVDYDVLCKKVNYFRLSGDFQQVLFSDFCKVKYIPILHDFCVLREDGRERILFMNSPFLLDPILFIHSKIPVSFDSTRPTYIHLLDTLGGGGGNGGEKVFVYEKGIAIFHYGEVKETAHEISIFASIYENIDFNDLNIIGRYRKIRINKITEEVIVDCNPELEKYNLDFPVIWKGEGFNRIILRNVVDETRQHINGFVICEEMEIVGRIFFDDLFMCGEPAVAIGRNNNSFLLSFAYDAEEKGYLLAVDLQTMNIERFPLDMDVTIGFHSIYIPRKDITGSLQ